MFCWGLGGFGRFLLDVVSVVVGGGEMAFLLMRRLLVVVVVVVRSRWRLLWRRIGRIRVIGVSDWWRGRGGIWGSR